MPSIKHIYGSYHLWCLNIFAPQSVLIQSVRDRSDTDRYIWENAIQPHSKKLLKRRFDFAGCSVEMPPRINWNVDNVNDRWCEEFYSFRWIDNLVAGNIISPNNQYLTASFIREFANDFIINGRSILHRKAWDNDVVGERLAHWMQHRRFILKGSSRKFRKRFGRSLIRHARLLHSAIIREPARCGFEVVWGLLSVSCCVGDMAFMRPAAESHLQRLIETEILKDGCHISGNPLQHLNILRILIDIRELIGDSGRGSSIHKRLCELTKKMGGVLRVFTHGDGRLALFNGALMGDSRLIKRVIELSGDEGVVAGDDICENLPHAGFYCIERKKTKIIMKYRGLSEVTHPQPHDAQLSFEFSDAGERFLVNCGQYYGDSRDWSDATSLPAAHSTLSFIPQPVVEHHQERGGGIGDIPLTGEVNDVARAAGSSPHITVLHMKSFNADSTDKNDMNIGVVSSGGDYEGEYVEAASDSYIDSLGMKHKRYIRLSRHGDSITGRDSIIYIGDGADGTGGTESSSCAYIRFHLHPDIRCKKVENGTMQMKSVSGKTWIFAVDNKYSANIEDSVYLGYYGRPQKTQQIVVSIPAEDIKNGRDGSVDIMWSFRRRP